MIVDVRFSWTVIWMAALAHGVAAVVAITAGFLFVPALSVVAGARTTAALSLAAATSLHIVVAAVFAIAMRRLDATALTCVVNLFVARLPTLMIGLLLGWVGVGVVGAPSRTDAGSGLLLQAGMQAGWALLSVVAGVLLGLLWVRVRDGAAE